MAVNNVGYIEAQNTRMSQCYGSIGGCIGLLSASTGAMEEMELSHCWGDLTGGGLGLSMSDGSEEALGAPILRRSYIHDAV